MIDRWSHLIRAFSGVGEGGVKGAFVGIGCPLVVSNEIGI